MITKQTVAVKTATRTMVPMMRINGTNYAVKAAKDGSAILVTKLGIEGRSEAKYLLRRNEATTALTCTCPAYAHKNACKHADAFLAALKNWMSFVEACAAKEKVKKL